MMVKNLDEGSTDNQKMIYPSLKENEVQVKSITDTDETLYGKNFSSEDDADSEKPQEDMKEQSAKESLTVDSMVKASLDISMHTYDPDMDLTWTEAFFRNGSLFRRDGNIYAKVRENDVLLEKGDILWTRQSDILSVYTFSMTEKKPEPKPRKRDIPKAGEVWRHANGKDYQVIAIAMNHGGQKRYVIYKEFGSDAQVWSRELDNFMGRKQQQDPSVNRFELVGRAAVDFGTGELVMVPLQ